MMKLENKQCSGNARTCDICLSAPSTVYCRADLAYLCSTCDARIHASSRHERVRVCEACEHVPAAFLCKADAASLCAACDSDIHSVNPLARRHHRVPAPLIYEDFESFGDEDETESWLLFNGDAALLFGGNHVDDYLDLDDYKYCEDQYQCHSVPQKNYEVAMNYRNEKDIKYEASNTDYNCPASMSHSVSLSPMDVGVVPQSTTSEVSIIHNYSRPPKGITELFTGNSIPTPIPTQLTPMDREARVLRYREKKKTRKFEKTIRYASRKAYAETRPRIKGRFAKRTDSESEVDQMFSTSHMAESFYGVVPTF